MSLSATLIFGTIGEASHQQSESSRRAVFRQQLPKRDFEFPVDSENRDLLGLGIERCGVPPHLLIAAMSNCHIKTFNKSAARFQFVT